MAVRSEGLSAALSSKRQRERQDAMGRAAIGQAMDDATRSYVEGQDAQRLEAKADEWNMEARDYDRYSTQEEREYKRDISEQLLLAKQIKESKDEKRNVMKEAYEEGKSLAREGVLMDEDVVRGSGLDVGKTMPIFQRLAANSREEKGLSTRKTEAGIASTKAGTKQTTAETGQIGKVKPSGFLGQLHQLEQMWQDGHPQAARAQQAIDYEIRQAAANVNATNVKVLEEIIKLEADGDPLASLATPNAKLTAASAIIKLEEEKPGSVDPAVLKDAYTVFIGNLQEGAQDVLGKYKDGSPEKEELLRAIEALSNPPVEEDE